MLFIVELSMEERLVPSKEREEILVAMRLRETPVPIPNTKVKP